MLVEAIINVTGVAIEISAYPAVSYTKCADVLTQLELI